MEKQDERVVGFILYGSEIPGDPDMVPIDFPDGCHRVFSSAEEATKACNELLTDPTQEWGEEDIVAVPVKMDEKGTIVYPNMISFGLGTEEAEEKEEVVTTDTEGTPC